MRTRFDVYPDFHLFGASAPEWNQRYVQLSPGVMRSQLIEARAEGVNFFRKSMSEQVVQEGGLPAGKICFVLPFCGPAQPPWMQGREAARNDLFVLRGGERFQIQRPRDAVVMAVAFDETVFERLAEMARWSAASRAMLRHDAITGPAARIAAFRRALEVALGNDARGPDTRDVVTLVHALHALVLESSKARQPLRDASAASILARCQRASSTSVDVPPSIGALCTRMRLSRRSVQNAFARVAGLPPTTYLRNVRLHAVRSALLDPVCADSVTHVALSNGFTHLGHFAGRYRALFGETPSRTRRQARRDAGIKSTAAG